MRKIIFIIMLCSQNLIYSQTVITGNIVDKSKKAQQDISVRLMDIKDSSIINYTTTNVDGKYKLQTTRKDSGFLISIYSFGIKRQTKYIRNESQSLNFTVEHSDIKLQEVVIKSTKIWATKDTINYSVLAFKNQKDVVIGDVLKKMPGISVADNGEISYRGLPINTFYIENMNMLGGRYGIATNNISASDVATVQVLEHHQPVKALAKTKPSESAAINLKIKEDRKGIFTSTAVLGGGYDNKLLWHDEIAGMYFGRHYQNISTFKADNTGTNISQELSSYSSNQDNGTMQMTRMSIPTGPGIRLERYLYNNSQIASINNLKKLKNDGIINYNFSLFNDKENRHSYTETDYLQPTGNTIKVNEDIASQMRTTLLNGEVKYSLNKPDKFLNNKLNFSGNWKTGTGTIANSSNINQNAENFYFKVNNTTHWVKTYSEGKGIDFISVNSFIRQPHSLTIYPGLYPSIFNDTTSYTSLTQNVLTSSFKSNNNLSFLSAWMIQNVRISPTFNLNFEDRLLESHFCRSNTIDTLKSVLNDSIFRNDLHAYRLNCSAGFELSYNYNDIKLNILLPSTFQTTRVFNIVTNDTYNHSRIFIQPSIKLMYAITNNWELKTAYSFNSNASGISSLYSAYILSDYRTLNRFDTQIFETYSKGGSIDISYKDILSMLFWGLGADYNYYKSNATYGQTIQGILTTTQLNMIPVTGSNISVKGQVSKGFNWKKMLTTATIEAGRYRGQQLRQQALLNYQTRWISGDASVNIKIANWMSLEYKFTGRWYQSSIDTGEKQPLVKLVNQKAGTDFFITDALSFNTIYEFYYNSAIQSAKCFQLVDAGLSYTMKAVRFSLDCTNILNVTKFITASNDGVNSYYSEYYIRPLAIMLKMRLKLK